MGIQQDLNRAEEGRKEEGDWSSGSEGAEIWNSGEVLEKEGYKALPTGGGKGHEESKGKKISDGEQTERSKNKLPKKKGETRAGKEELMKEVALQVKVALANIKEQIKEEDYIRQIEVYTDSQIQEVKRALEAKECSKTKAKKMAQAIIRAETTAITTFQTVAKYAEDSRKRKWMEDEKEGEVEFRQLIEEAEKEVAKKLRSRKRARSVRGLGYEGIQAGKGGKKTPREEKEATEVGKEATSAVEKE